eukprot:8147051-Pyramimonas_sp.AAC.1
MLQNSSANLAAMSCPTCVHPIADIVSESNADCETLKAILALQKITRPNPPTRDRHSPEIHTGVLPFKEWSIRKIILPSYG